jgi:DNA polymerase III gamma/tau subunit
MNQWDFLKKKFEAGQLGHAYLLFGRDAESIKKFAKEFIKLINCLTYDVERSKKDYCGKCQNCQMIDRQVFPDLIVVKSSDSESSQKNKKDMMSIEIDQIRDVQNFLGYKSYYGGYKSVIMENAERMTVEAQNCFLKNLEEPRGKTIIFLISSNSDFLLPTIYSRCQSVFFENSGSSDKISENIELGGLLNIINKDLSEKFKYAKSVNLDGDNFDKILDELQRHFRGLLLAKIRIKSDVNMVIGANGSYSVEKIKSILKVIENIKYQVATSNVNSKLTLEVVLLELS